MVKWIKITTDIFDHEKIKLIDSMPARDEILVIWFKLLALAGKSNENGLLFFKGRTPYNEEMLSTIFNRELNSIRLALKTFQDFEMVHIEENEVITISNWEKYQNIDGLDKIRDQTKKRVAKHRAKQKQLAECNVTVSLRNGIDKEIDKEKELDYISEIEQIGIRCYGRTLKPIEIDAIEQYIKQYSLKTVQDTAKSCGLLGWKSIKSLGNALEDPSILDKRDSFNDKTPQKVSYNYLLSNPELMDKYKIIKPGLPNDVENWELK